MQERGDGMPSGFYGRWVLPHLMDFAMRNPRLAAYRARTAAAARGEILEIGIGSGLNLSYYGTATTAVHGLDPSRKLLRMARAAGRPLPFRLDLVEGSAAALPLPARSIDTVLVTWSLCSIPEPCGALSEMRRVLRPEGRLLFVEHGLAPDPGIAAWQHRLTPLWRRLAGGCHLDRRMDDLVTSCGFALERIERGYAPGPRALTYFYEGIARPR